MPVLNRPQNANPLVENIRSTSKARIVFVCSPNDTDQIAACQQTDADVLVVDWQPGQADFARKTNLAFNETEEEWVFTGADDLVFHPDWDKQAVSVGQAQRAGVVGTQDLGNMWVKRGVQSTHSLVSREYIMEMGGTVEGEPKIYCELYDHQWVDCELVEVAKSRKKFAFAKRAVVEHMHPHWKKAELDSTYEKAVRATKQDMALYQRRMRQLRTVSSRNRRRSTL